MTGVSIHGTGMTTDDVIRKAHDTLPVATSSAAGVVKIGSGVSVTGDGTISVAGGGGGAFPVAPDGYTETYPVVDGTGGDSYGHDVVLRSGNNGGGLTLRTGNDVDGGGVGTLTLATGDGRQSHINITTGSSGTHNGSDISLTSGAASSGHGGDITLHPGASFNDGSHSGRLVVQLPPGSGGATDGLLIVQNMPASDPAVSDAIWSDNGVLVQSGHTAPVTTGLNVTSIDWSTAPTSDPAQAGALWNDAGTLKISAG